MSRRMAAYSGSTLDHTIMKATLSPFLPRLVQSSLEQLLTDSNISMSAASFNKNQLDLITCEVKDGRVRIGSTEAAVYRTRNRAKVPDILFYDNSQHLKVMEEMLQDFCLGEHLLLVGNQGVGKNKIVDRFLQLLNRPREYIQLHRFTVQYSLRKRDTH